MKEIIDKLNLNKLKTALLETTQMSILRWMYEQIVVHPCTRILQSNKSKWIIDTYDKMDDS